MQAYWGAQLRATQLVRRDFVRAAIGFGSAAACLAATPAITGNTSHVEIMAVLIFACLCGTSSALASALRRRARRWPQQVTTISRRLAVGASLAFGLGALIGLASAAGLIVQLVMLLRAHYGV